MNLDGLRVLRKRLPEAPIALAFDDASIANDLDLRACSEVYFSSAHPDHPIDHLFDGSTGEGASRWVAGRRDRSETVLFIFDEPVNLTHCAFEAEECDVPRTQQVTAEYLLASGDIYRTCFVQEFNFSPGGAVYQRELIELDLRNVRRFRFTILADKSGRGYFEPHGSPLVLEPVVVGGKRFTKSPSPGPPFRSPWRKFARLRVPTVAA